MRSVVLEIGATDHGELLTDGLKAVDLFSKPASTRDHGRVFVAEFEVEEGLEPMRAGEVELLVNPVPKLIAGQGDGSLEDHISGFGGNATLAG